MQAKAKSSNSMNKRISRRRLEAKISLVKWQMKISGANSDLVYQKAEIRKARGKTRRSKEKNTALPVCQTIHCLRNERKWDMNEQNLQIKGLSISRGFSSSTIWTFWCFGNEQKLRNDESMRRLGKEYWREEGNVVIAR